MLPPAEVLEKAAVRSSSLQSARYTLIAEGTVRSGGALWTPRVSIEGVLQEGGRQSQGTLAALGSVTRAEGPVAFRIDGEFLVTSPRDFYLRLISLSVTPPSALPALEALQALQGGWWKLPSGDAGGAPAPAPDPRLLRAQTQVVRVTRDLGMTTIHDHPAYHYRVEIDQEKLRSYLRAQSGRSAAAPTIDAEGELWIDAETFYLHRLEWIVAESASRGRSWQLVGTGSLAVELRDHDKAPGIRPPADFRALGSGNVLHDLMPRSPIPPPPPDA